MKTDEERFWYDYWFKQFSAPATPATRTKWKTVIIPKEELQGDITRFMRSGKEKKDEQ